MVIRENEDLIPLLPARSRAIDRRRVGSEKVDVK